MKYKLNGQWVDVQIKALDSMPIGSIIQFAGSEVPDGWLLCDGATLEIASYQELYIKIGTTYGGSGDYFNLPNLKGKIPVGQNTVDGDFNVLGKTGGGKTTSYTPAGTNTGGAVGGHALTGNELTYHRHTLAPTEFMSGKNMLNAGTANQGGAWVGNDQFALAAARNMPGTNFPDALSTGNLMQTLYTDYQGGNAAHDHPFTQPTFTGTAANISTVQPYLVINYIIKAFTMVPTMASVVSTYNENFNNTYSCEYINTHQCVYDTDEKIIGVWVDGKPIYRKCFVGNYSNADMLISQGCDTLINAYGTVTINNVKRIIPLYENDSFAPTKGFVAQAGDKVGIALYYENTALSNVACNIILEYTKVSSST